MPSWPVRKPAAPAGRESFKGSSPFRRFACAHKKPPPWDPGRGLFRFDHRFAASLRRTS